MFIEHTIELTDKQLEKLPALPKTALEVVFKEEFSIVGEYLPATFNEGAEYPELTCAGTEEITVWDVDGNKLLTVTAKDTELFKQLQELVTEEDVTDMEVKMWEESERQKVEWDD